MKLSLFILAASLCMGQTGVCQWQGTPPTCVPITAPPAVKAVTSAAAVPAKPASLPNLALVGAEYGTSTSPHFSGFAALALPVSATAGLYSYSMYQGIIVGGKLATSTTTGLADDLKTVCIKPGCFVLVGLGTAGVSTSSVTQSAFAGGGGLLYRSTSGWVAGIMGIQNSAGGVSKPNLLVGFGRTW